MASVTLDDIEGVCDRILGPKSADLLGSDVAIVDRVEFKLGSVIDRQFPEKVASWFEFVGKTNSPMIKAKNIEMYAKGMWAQLQAAAKAGAANNKRPAPKKSEGGSKKRKSSTGAALAAGKSEGDDRATTPAGEGSASAAAQRDPPAKEKPRVLVPVSSIEKALENSDGRLRGDLQIIERCPALVYNDWKDVDHDVYLFGLTQLAADKRKKPPEGGKVAYFLGFGSYRDYTAHELKGGKMPGDTKTRDRPLEEVLDFLDKSSLIKGGKGEGGRRKAYRDAARWFQATIYKVEADHEPPVKKPAKRPTKKGAIPGQPPRKKRTTLTYVPVIGADGQIVPPAPVAAPAPPPPPPVVAPPVAPPRPPTPPPPPPLLEDSAVDEEIATVVNGDPGHAGERTVEGLFDLLTTKLGELEQINGGDPFIWSLNSAYSNLENLLDRVLSVKGPELDEARRMMESGVEKMRKKIEDRLKALTGGSVIKAGEIIRVCYALKQQVRELGKPRPPTSRAPSTAPVTSQAPLVKPEAHRAPEAADQPPAQAPVATPTAPKADDEVQAGDSSVAAEGEEQAQENGEEGGDEGGEEGSREEEMDEVEGEGEGEEDGDEGEGGEDGEEEEEEEELELEIGGDDESTGNVEEEVALSKDEVAMEKPAPIEGTAEGDAERPAMDVGNGN